MADPIRSDLLKSLQLTEAAKQLISNQELPAPLEQHLASIGASRVLTETELAILMLQHSPPDQHQHIQNKVAALYDGKGPHTDGTNKDFVGQIAHILSAQIDKEIAVPFIVRRNIPQPPAPPPSIAYPRRDPLKGKVFFPEAADFVVIANNSSTDKNRIMDVVHILVREGAEARLANIDFTASRLRYQARKNQTDITVVQPESAAVEQGKEGRAAIVDFVDTDEHQFRGRDKMVAIAFDSKGAELRGSRDGRTTEANVQIFEYAPLKPSAPNEPLKPALDTIPFNEGRPYVVQGDQADSPSYTHEGVQIGDQIGRAAIAHRELIRLPLIENPSIDPRVQWTATPMSGFSMGLVVGQGTVAESGEQLKVQLLGTTVDTSAPAGDWNVPGNPAQLRSLNVAPVAGQTYGQAMASQHLTITSLNHAYDQVQQTPTIADQVMLGTAGASLARQPLKWAADEEISVADAKARGITVGWTTGRDGSLQPVVSIKEGLLSGTAEAPVVGWRVDVGYVSANKWSGAPTMQIKEEDNRSMTKTMSLPAVPAEAVDSLLTAGFVQVQVRNHEGHMIQRLRIPMKDIQHGTRAAA